MALAGQVLTPALMSMGHSPCKWSRGPGHTALHRPVSPRGPPDWCRGTCIKTHGNTILELNVLQEPDKAKRARAHTSTEETSWSWWLPTRKGTTIHLPASRPVWDHVFKYTNYASDGGGTVWVPVSWQSLLWRWWEPYGNPHISSCGWGLCCRQLAIRHSPALASHFGKDKCR